MLLLLRILVQMYTGYATTIYHKLIDVLMILNI